MINHKHINLIVAKNEVNSIGLHNKLLYKLKNDMIFFRKKTLGQIVVMGRNTFESLPKPLSNRENLVMSTVLSSFPTSTDSYKVFYDAIELTTYLNSLPADDTREVYIIGGASIYERFLPLCDTLYITEIEDALLGDTFFPSFDKSLYIETILESHEQSGLDERAFTIKSYTKRPIL